MLRKPCKTIKNDNGVTRIYGNGHWIPIDHEQPDWSEHDEACFTYKGCRYFLSTINSTHNQQHMPDKPAWLDGFDGIKSEGFGFGIVVKLGTDDNHEQAVKAYTYIASSC